MAEDRDRQDDTEKSAAPSGHLARSRPGFPRARLVVSAGLFLAWIGFLAYLVARTRDPVILSRPQLAAASLVVLVDIQEKDGRPLPAVVVKKVAWALLKDQTTTAGSQLVVHALADCGPKQGWRGAGEYLVPLTGRRAVAGASYEVTPLPISPGYNPEYVSLELVQEGPNKEKVAELMNKALGPAPGKDAADQAPRRARHNIPRHEADPLKRQLEMEGATVRIAAGEQRIYRATSDALAQLEELAAARR
jgi:hypothetical protein